MGYVRNLIYRPTKHCVFGPEPQQWPRMRAVLQDLGPAFVGESFTIQLSFELLASLEYLVPVRIRISCARN